MGIEIDFAAASWARALWGKESESVNGKVCLQAWAALRPVRGVIFTSRHDEIEPRAHFLIFESSRLAWPLHHGSWFFHVHPHACPLAGAG
jgi:hypothetical protein